MLCKVLSDLINYIQFISQPKSESHKDPNRWISPVFLYFSVLSATAQNRAALCIVGEQKKKKKGCKQINKKAVGCQD